MAEDMEVKTLIVDQSEDSREAARIVKFQYPHLEVQQADPDDIANHYGFPRLITNSGSLIGLGHIRLFMRSRFEALVTRMNLTLMTMKQTNEILSEPGVFEWGHFQEPIGHSQINLEWRRIAYLPENTKIIGQELALPFCQSKISKVLSSVGGWSMLLGEEVARTLGPKTDIAYAATISGGTGVPISLRQGFSINRGERVLIVHDIAAYDPSIGNLAAIVHQNKAKVAGIAVFASCSEQITQRLREISEQVHVLVQLELKYYPSVKVPPSIKGPVVENCPMCQEGIPLIEA